jgi:hypothetical protein
LRSSDLWILFKTALGRSVAHFHPFDKPDGQARLKPLIRDTQPYPKKIAHRGVVEPSLLAKIEYRPKSAEAKVRHPFFKGIRETNELGLGAFLDLGFVLYFVRRDLMRWQKRIRSLVGMG